MGYTHRWHMERNLGFVATFLHLSPQCWRVKKMKKSEENAKNEEKWSKNEEKWRKAKKSEEN